MSKIFKSDEDIRHILVGICDLTLPKLEWTHEAHFAAAVAILADPNFEAMRDMPQIIRLYNEATGVQNTDHEGYHHTITIASLHAVKAFMAGRSVSLLETHRKLLSLEYGRSDWLLSYWSQDLLFSKRARKTWVDPDLRIPNFEAPSFS